MLKWGGCNDQTISDLLEVFKAEEIKCLQGDAPPEGRGKSQGPEFEVDGFSCCSSVQPALGEMLRWSGATSQLTQHVAASLKCVAHIQPKNPWETLLSNIPLPNPSPVSVTTPNRQRQQSQHYPKHLAEPAAGFCHLLDVMKTGQIKNILPLASFTWRIISSQLTSKKWPGKESRNEIWWQIHKYGQLSLWWSILDGSSVSKSRIFWAFILCQHFKPCPQSIFE